MPRHPPIKKSMVNKFIIIFYFTMNKLGYDNNFCECGLFNAIILPCMLCSIATCNSCHFQCHQCHQFLCKPCYYDCSTVSGELTYGKFIVIQTKDDRIISQNSFDNECDATKFMAGNSAYHMIQFTKYFCIQCCEEKNLK